MTTECGIIIAESMTEEERAFLAAVQDEDTRRKVIALLKESGEVK